LERFLEIAAPSRALSPHCRIDPKDGSGVLRALEPELRTNVPGLTPPGLKL
jgi:hypothetical protein